MILENKARYTLVGFFLLVFSVAMVAFILWLARYDIKEVDAKEFRIYSTKSIAGLNENSIVEYKGLDIGTVKTIQINPKNLEEIEIILKITQAQVIKTNSYAIVQSQGVTGNKIIEIDGGTKDAKPLEVKEGSYAVLPLQKSFFDKITSSAGNITSQIETILIRFEKLLNEKNMQNIENILSNVDTTSANFNQMLEKLDDLVENSLAPTLNNLNSMTRSVDGVVKKDISKTINKINSMTSNIDTLSKDIRTIVNEDVKSMIKEIKSTAKSTQHIDKVLYDLETTLEKIDDTVEEFNQNGGDMLFKTRKVNYGPGEENEIK